MKLKYLLLVVFIGLSLQAAFAQDAEEPIEQQEVYIGVYVNQVFALSLRDNQFSIDFYIWFRWKGEGVKPLESFEVVNGRVDSKDGEYEDVVDGFNYASCRVVATITKFWDIARFPLDNHVLTIEIEDSDNEEFKLKYIPDSENCGMNPELQAPGWIVPSSNAQVLGHGYKTNYGDISLPTNNESVYSRFIYSINIVRPGIGYFLKLFFTVFVATLIALIALFIKPTDLDPRFGLGAGALFAAVASEVVIASSLPDTNVMTLPDKLHMIAIMFIFLSIAESIISLRYFTNEKETLSIKLDRVCFYGFTFIYLLLTLLAIVIK